MTFLGMLCFTLLLHVLWFGWVFLPGTSGVVVVKDDLKDSSSLSSPPMLFLRDIHFKLLTQYDSKEVRAPSQSQVGGTSARPTSQNDFPQQQESAQLSLPQLNRLFEDSFVCDESSASTADVVVIPYQHKVTFQILIHWQSFIDLKPG
jgi:hypothetical protein